MPGVKSVPHETVRNLEEKIRSAQIHQLYLQARPGLVGAMVAAVFLTVVVWDTADRVILLGWLSAYTALSCWRYYSIRLYYRKAQTLEDMSPWATRLIGGNFCAGLLWAAGCWLLFPSTSLPDQLLFILALTGVACAAVTVHWPLLWACLPTVLLILLGMAGRLLWAGNEFHLFAAFAAVPMAGILTYMALHMHQLGSESFRLRFEKDALLSALHLGTLELEKRVSERTAELQEANESLKRLLDEKSRVQVDLATNEGRLRALIENAEDLIFIKDCDLKYTHVNPAVLEALGMREEEIIGKDNSLIFSAPEARYLREFELRVLAGQSITREYILNVRNQERVFTLSIFPMRDDKGSLIGICGIGRDVTDHAFRNNDDDKAYSDYTSPVTKKMLMQLRRVTSTDSTVLLLGESGCGKDFWARWLHEHSERAVGKFLAVNCAALPRELAESELFGHEPGAFTGATHRKRGVLELAEGGTLLLNEIGELSQEMQAKLLMFLDTQTLYRVGGEKQIAVNARIVSATNRKLREEVKSGRFREDLFHRINVFTIELPPLRERTDDIPLLCQELLAVLSRKLGRSSVPRVHSKAMGMMCSYMWPGNVRELKNVLERALIFCEGDRILSRHLSTLLGENLSSVIRGDDLTAILRVSPDNSLTDQVEAAKKSLIEEALSRTDGNVTAAARMLGTTRDILRHQIKKLNMNIS